MKKIGLAATIIIMLINIASAQSSKVSSAITYLANGELDRAQEAIELAAVNEKTATQAKTWFYRGKIYSAIAFDQTGKYTDLSDKPLDVAMESFQKAMSMPDVKNLKSQMLIEYQYLQMGYFNQGAQAYGNKDFEKAYTSFSKSSEANMLQLEIDPTMAIDTGVIFNTGLTAEKIGKTDEAIAIYQRLVDMKYNEPYVYQSLSNLYASKGMEDKALEVIETGRKSFPQNEALIISELNYYLSRGNVGVIVDKLEEAIAIDPDNIQLYFALGNANGELIKTASLESGTPSSSLKSCAGEPQSIEKDESNMNVSKEVWKYDGYSIAIEGGKVVSFDGDNKKINDLIKKCSNPEQAQAYFDAAVSAYQKAIDLQPENFEANLNLGALYYNKAIELNKYMINLPLDADAEYTAMEKKRNGLYTQALPYFEAAHKSNPTDIPTMQALKEIYAKTGNMTKVNEMKLLLGE